MGYKRIFHNDHYATMGGGWSIPCDPGRRGGGLKTARLALSEGFSSRLSPKVPSHFFAPFLVPCLLIPRLYPDTVFSRIFWHSEVF